MQGVRDVTHSILFEIKLSQLALSPGNPLLAISELLDLLLYNYFRDKRINAAKSLHTLAPASAIVHLKLFRCLYKENRFIFQKADVFP